jgi:hypothetical protein
LGQFLKTQFEIWSLSADPGIPEGKIKPIVVVELFVMVIVVRRPVHAFG